MTKKRILITGIFIALIIASLATIFLLNKRENTIDSNFEPSTSLEAGITESMYEGMAEDLGISREELDERLNEPLDLTPEQQARREEIYADANIPEVDKFIEDDDPNDNEYA